MIQILVIIKNYARTLSLLTGLQINLSREFRFILKLDNQLMKSKVNHLSKILELFTSIPRNLCTIEHQSFFPITANQVFINTEEKNSSPLNDKQQHCRSRPFNNSSLSL